MANRDDLKVLIDQLPDERLDIVRRMLDYHVNPPPPKPEIERMQQRGMAYQQQVVQAFRESSKPGTIRTGGGSGSFGEHEGVPFGRESFQFWDNKALVYHSLQSFDGDEIEVTERLSFSDDRTALVCDLELSSGGCTVRYHATFPTGRLSER